MRNKIERRVMRGIGPLRVERRANDDGPSMIVGHAAVFDTLSDELWGFREKIAPGAFKRSIKEDDVRALWNHDPRHVLGRVSAETLRLSEDKVGLAMEIDPPDAGWARDLMVSIERGDVTQASFAFLARGEEWAKEEGVIIRTVTEAQLFDVSPVTYPAYPETDVGVRSVVVSDDTLERFQQEKRKAAAVARDLHERLVRLAEVS